MLWGDDPSILHVGYVRPGGSFVVGSSGADFAIGEDALRFDRLPIVVAAERGPCAVVPPGATAVLTHGSTNVRLEELVTFRSRGRPLTREGFALTGIEGAALVPIADEVVVRMRIGEFTFVVRGVELPRIERRRLMLARGGAALVVVASVAFAFFGVRSLVPPSRPTAFDEHQRLAMIASGRAPELKNSRDRAPFIPLVSIEQGSLPRCHDAAERWLDDLHGCSCSRTASSRTCTAREDTTWWVRVTVNPDIEVHGLLPRERARARLRAWAKSVESGCRWRNALGGSSVMTASIIVWSEGTVQSASIATSSSRDVALDSCLQTELRWLRFSPSRRGISVVHFSLRVDATTRAPPDPRYGYPSWWDAVVGSPACIL